VNLAFLAPDIIESIIAGHQPAGFNVEKLTKRTDLPLEWARQRQLQIPYVDDEIHEQRKKRILWH
jgi:hypothetical protein